MFLILTVLAAVFFAGCSDSGNSYDFEAGWYKYNDGYSTLYILYNDDGEVCDVITSTDAYMDSQLEIAKTAYSGDRDEVTSCLTRLTDQYYELPEFYREEAFTFATKYSVGGTAKSFNYGIEIYAAGDTFTVTCGLASEKLSGIIKSSTDLKITEVSVAEGYTLLGGSLSFTDDKITFVMDDTVVT
ncbi:hypothetical protein, partial [Treponema sp.]|uniref:hypothetical protein n=1 Tax=Treponema sp. TaxID=166 RepID=UPI0025E0B262